MVAILKRIGLSKDEEIVEKAEKKVVKKVIKKRVPTNVRENMQKEHLIKNETKQQKQGNLLNNEYFSDKKQEIEELLWNSFLRPYLEDETITDISFNGTTLWVQSNKIGRYVPDKQPTHDIVYRLGKRIADIQGKEFTTNNTILDTDLHQLRVNFVHEEVSPSGCTFAIRVSKPRLVTSNLADFANQNVADLFSALIKAESNIIISGRTGAGKTELQKLLVGFIENHKKITLMEDTMDSHIKELYPEKDINSWRTLTEDTRDKKVTFHDLNKAGLRNNPDWMIIAETRGGIEAYSMLESALTDHAIITTIHAKGAGAIPNRLISMIGQSYQVNELLLGQDIVNTFKFGVYLSTEFKEGGIKRFISEIVEYTGFSEKGVEYTQIYKVGKEYNKETNEYKKVFITNPLSEGTVNDLRNKEVIHLIPDIFLPKEVSHG